eukprot:tig00000158_g10157.t1
MFNRNTRARAGPRARRIAHHRPRLRLCRIIGEPAEGARCGRICRDLDLSALIEDDNGMELLVAGQIVRLDLSIRQVYEQVWRRSLGGDQAGLDGEATEPIVDALEDTAGPERDPEEEFAAAAIRSFRTLDVNADLVALVLRLARHCALLAANRARMLALGGVRVLLDVLRLAFADERHADEAEALLLTLESLVEAATAAAVAPDAAAAASGGDRERLSDAAVVSQLRMFLEKARPPALRAPRPPRPPAPAPPAPPLTAPAAQFLTYGRAPAMELIADYFAPHLDWEALAGRSAPTRRRASSSNAPSNSRTPSGYPRPPLPLFFAAAHGPRRAAPQDDANGQRLKDLILARGVPAAPPPSSPPPYPPQVHGGRRRVGGGAGVAGAALGAAAPHGLCRGHPATQRVLLETNVLPLCHFLEQITQGGSKVGIQAENLLEAAAGGEGGGEADAGVREAVRALRDATRREKRKLALAKREKLLADLGMRLDAGGESGAGGGGGGEAGDAAAPEAGPSGAGGGGRIVASREAGRVRCMVCREGYAYKPREPMGAYVYLRRVPVGEAPPRAPGVAPGSPVGGGRGGSGPGEAGVASSSHFNTIHFACHRDATRAERSLKARPARPAPPRPARPARPGAVLTRRGRSPRGMGRGDAAEQPDALQQPVPLAGPLVPADAYAQATDRFWQQAAAALGRLECGAPAARLRLALHDARLLLARLAHREAFAGEGETLRGTRESNLCLLPHILYAAAAALDAAGPATRAALAAALAAFAQSGPAAAVSAAAGAGIASPGGGGGAAGATAGAEAIAADFGADGGAHLALVAAVLLLPPAEWRARRLALLRRALAAGARHGPRYGAPPASASSSSSSSSRAAPPSPALFLLRPAAPAADWAWRRPPPSSAAGDGDAVAALCERVRADERPVLASSRRIAEAYAAACAAAARPPAPPPSLPPSSPAAEEAAAEGGLEALVERAAGDR